jgi:hypothetical protein
MLWECRYLPILNKVTAGADIPRTTAGVWQVVHGFHGILIIHKTLAKFANRTSSGSLAKVKDSHARGDEFRQIMPWLYNNYTIGGSVIS